MTLLRGFSEVDDECKVVIPSHIRNKAGLAPGVTVDIKVVRIKGSNRWPYIVVHNSHTSPRLSRFQVVVAGKVSRIDGEGRLELTEDILKDCKLQHHYRVEIKLMGPNNGQWVVIHNRGPNIPTTLQLKMGVKKIAKGEKWQKQEWGY